MKYKKRNLTQVEVTYRNGDTNIYDDILYITGSNYLRLRSVYGDIFVIASDEIRNVNYLKYHSDEIIRI